MIAVFTRQVSWARESLLEVPASFLSSSEAMLIVFLDFMNPSLWKPCPSSKGEEDKFELDSRGNKSLEKNVVSELF